MNLYSYVVKHDSGFAPNPFYNYCTLATCKPQIRKEAQIGDWVLGVTSADTGNRRGQMVYAMEVAETMSFNDYFEDPRFNRKRPILHGSKQQARGDNIYLYTGETWNQLNSFHSNADGSPNFDHIQRDTSVNRVLIGHNYKYFGCNSIALPDLLGHDNKSIIYGYVGRRKFSSDNPADNKLIQDFIHWFQNIEGDGLIGNPDDWSDCQQAC